jgi:aminoglycoside 3-N-acetyltransferase I
MKRTDKIFEVKRLAKQDLADFKSLVNLFNTVFEEAETNIQSDTNLNKLLNNDNFIALAAISESEVVGGLTAYELPMYYSKSSEVFLYDMAVKTEYQRIGIGKQLISGLKEYCNKNGIEEFFVLAHEEDEHAIEFYHSTGGKSEKVVNFLYESEN